jgi:uncharacterized protein
MNKIITFFIVTIITIIVTIIYKFRYLKNYFYYHPSKSSSVKPSSEIIDINIPYGDNKNKKNNKKLNAWYYLHNSNENNPMLLFCHGNAGNIGSRNSLLLKMIDHGISFLIFDYKGFGNSDGETIIDSTFLDAEICYKYIKNKLNISSKNIIPFGESIGSYPASKLAVKYKLNKLFLLGGFNSISMTVKHMGSFGGILQLLTKGDLDVGKNLSTYKGQTIILHSKQDMTINYENAKLNYKIAHKNNDKSILKTITGGHNTHDIDWNYVKDNMF